MVQRQRPVQSSWMFSPLDFLIVFPQTLNESTLTLDLVNDTESNVRQKIKRQLRKIIQWKRRKHQGFIVVRPQRMVMTYVHLVILLLLNLNPVIKELGFLSFTSLRGNTTIWRIIALYALYLSIQKKIRKSKVPSLSSLMHIYRLKGDCLGQWALTILNIHLSRQ